MLLKFIGKYTGGRNAITIAGVTFEGREPAEVAADSSLLTHPEFEVVETMPEPDAAPVAAPKPRGRPRKA